MCLYMIKQSYTNVKQNYTKLNYTSISYHQNDN